MKFQDLTRGFIAIVVVFALLWLGRELLLPLVLAFFLWYLIHTLRTLFARLRLRGRSLPGWLNLTLAGVAILGVLGFLMDLITRNLGQVIKAAPQYQVNLNGLIAKAYALAGAEQEPPRLEHLFSDLDLGSLISGTASALASFAGQAGFVLILMLFIFLEQKYFSTKLLALVPGERDQQDTLRLIERIDEDVRRYIGVKSLVSALTSVLSYAILKLAGLHFAEFWAVMIFILNFIPSVGSIIATLLPTLLALVQFSSLGPVLVVGLGVGGVEAVVGNFLDPRLTGQSLNLSPLAIILSLTLWGMLWGVAGMFLCVPITVVLMIILSHFDATRPFAILLSQKGKIREG